MIKRTLKINHTLFYISLFLFSTTSIAELAVEKEALEVIGVTVTHGVGLPEKLIPYSVQSASSDDIDQSQTLGLADFLDRHLGSVTINNAQNNPLQNDIQYRGYTLSPLLGLPQGLAVFQNGVRINEPFGDSMNWDLIPESSIANINLIGGANPVFGLNALGGALSITTKNGFTHQGHNIESYGGSFGRLVTTVSSGGNNGEWGYFFTGEYFDEEGWRANSASDAINLFSALSYRNIDTMLDLTINLANTDLIGNGTVPVELLALDREAVFTSPDQTENKLIMLNLAGTHWLNDFMQLGGNLFYRKNKTNSFNGDGSEFGKCTGLAAFLCAEDAPNSPITDQNGNRITAQINGQERNAINNISQREQEGFGINLQMTLIGDLFSHKNQFIVGAGYQQGIVDFFSTIEIAQLNCTALGQDCTLVRADRSTIRTGLFVPQEGTNIKAHHRVWSLYATDTVSVNEQLALTASLRYNNSHIVLGDRSSESNLANPEDPDELNGEHDFHRINPAVGMTYNLNEQLNLYGNYSESSRAPTPIELLCARPDAPCNLPNAFLADPPLEQVVTKGFEMGFRGTLGNDSYYQISTFHSTNNDDIIFGSTGGVASNEGYFRNVGDTQRLGAEISLAGVLAKKLQWSVAYSYVEATFEDRFLGTSANHPNKADLGGGTNGNDIQVDKGNRIPGIPKHALKINGLYSFTNKLSAGINIIYNSNQVFRGDESNQLAPIDGYAIVNLNGSYAINNNVTVFARINNVLDTDYEAFGLLGEADEIFDGSGVTPAFANARFLSAGAPINGFVGIAIDF